MLLFSLEMVGKKQLLGWLAQPLWATGFSSSALFPHSSLQQFLMSQTMWLWFFFSSIKGKTITSWVSPFPYHLKAHARAWPCNLCALIQGGMFWGSWAQAVKSSGIGSVLWGAALSAGLLLQNANRSTKTWYFQVDHTKGDHRFHTAGAVWVSFNILNW